MGRKGSWFSSIKKAFSPEKKGKKVSKSNKKWVEKEQPLVPESSNQETSKVSPPHPLPLVEELKLADEEKEQTVQSYPVAIATASAAESSAPTAQIASEVVRPTPAHFAGKSREEDATIKIQTAFRGYLARRALKALRGLVRLKSLVDGPTVKRQTANALKCMQALSRVQSQIHSRRNRMLEENRALQRQLLQKHAKELESLRRGDGWDDSIQSKEQIEASLLSKYEAAMRRERALAYSYSHQQTWKKSSRSSNLLFMDPTNPQWGWSWLERWMGGRSLEAQSMSEKELKNDQSSVKSGGVSIIGGEITRSFARHQLNNEQPFSPSSQKPGSTHHSPATPASKPPSARKTKLPSPRVSATSQDDDTKSMLSIQSERNRRHSIAGSSVRDDESLASFQSIPSYMTPTKSAKAKTRLQSPLGMENVTPEKGSAGSVKKRLSYPPSPARPRRHSGPPKVNISTVNTNGETN
ncbi:protein IQ-DOMAIN 1-like [Ipomoea triloba]|uniref:protein IQ-DOMAIN 1-like n=1 Tax=Ipomoea triloba TaxID=35885 RepID=UPI00125D6C27|nr:protein IQ-DOMAIN 1-like [Ipomoea triloba]XP_031092477.1 protein IQ-DOMAIN 1-like [Ipomoea triloba]